MNPKFNIDRPKVSDEEISKHKDFDKLVKQFKEQSIKKARGDESWWKNKRIQYAAVIGGITVVCTVTYYSILKDKKQQNKVNETLITQKKELKTTPAPSTAFVKEPSQKLKINYSTYKVDNSKETTLTHPGGSKIKVPKNAFVNRNGNDIQGEVTIEYREFHDLAEVVVSGIPMQYDSAGKSYNLESAGMFDIRGHQNGEPVYIKPDKQLRVELASRSAEKKFNQYYLDTLNRNWLFIKHDSLLGLHLPGNRLQTGGAKKAPPSEKAEWLQKQAEEIIPKRIDSVKIVYAKKIDKLPLPAQPHKPVKFTEGKNTFQFDCNKDEFPELAAFDNVIFEVGAENKNYSKELHEITWSDVKISAGPDKGRNYLLMLSYRGRREQLIVYPLLAGADYDKARKLYDEKLSLYQEKKEKRETEEKRLLAEMEAKQAALLAQQAKLREELKKKKEALLARYDMAAQNELADNFKTLSDQQRAGRLFEVARFGIYNSDCPHKMPDGKDITPSFVAQEGHRALTPYAVYFINYNNKTVVVLKADDYFRFKASPAETYALCVFVNNKLYLCNQANFKSGIENSLNQFLVQPLPEGSDNLADFKKALAI